MTTKTKAKPKASAPKAPKKREKPAKPLEIAYLAPDALKPYARNARTHSEDQVAQIAASITEFGFTNPILADGKNGVIAGHGRLLAAQALKLPAVPVIRLHGLSPAQKMALVIADNRIAEKAGWDMELLRLELGVLSEMGMDLELTGFSQEEADEIIALGRELGDPEETPEPVADPAVRAGDYWHMGAHRLLVGDSTDAKAVAKLLCGQIPILLCTDPPYGVNYDPADRGKMKYSDGSLVSTGKGRAVGKVHGDEKSDWRGAWMLFPGDVAYIWHADLHARSVVESLEACGFVLRAQIIWAKATAVISRGHYHFQHEPCWYAVRKDKTANWTGDRKQTTVWEIDRPHKSETGHGTQKPIDCMQRPIINNTKRGQAVYDPFCGSGTTLIAAEMEGRVAYCMEIDPAYGQVIVERWEAFTGETALLDGKTPFADIVASRKRKTRDVA